MSQPDKKLEKFSSAVLKDAEEQRTRTLSEIDSYRRTELEKAEEEILHDAYVMIQNQIAAIKNRQSREISLTELEGRRKLLKLRESLTKQVFDDAAAKIIDYTKTEAYRALLCSIVKKSCLSIPEGPVVLEVKKEDLRLAADLQAACGGRQATVEANDNITLGGVILYNREKGIIVDETLDLKLSAQKDWFASSSGLSIGL